MPTETIDHTAIADIIKHYPEITGIHPACQAVPPMSDQEYRDLVEDVKRIGLLHPIVLTWQGLLLDGCNRLRACFEAKVEPKFTKTDRNYWGHVNSANIQRRHLTTGQKAVFAQAYYEHEKSKAKERQGERTDIKETFPESSTGQARDKAGALVGVSGRSVEKAAKVQENSPELFEKLRQGEIDLEPAYRQVSEIRQVKEIERQNQAATKKTCHELEAERVERMRKKLQVLGVYSDQISELSDKDIELNYWHLRTLKGKARRNGTDHVSCCLRVLSSIKYAIDELDDLNHEEFEDYEIDHLETEVKNFQEDLAKLIATIETWGSPHA